MPCNAISDIVRAASLNQSQSQAYSIWLYMRHLDGPKWPSLGNSLWIRLIKTIIHGSNPLIEPHSRLPAIYDDGVGFKINGDALVELLWIERARPTKFIYTSIQYKWYCSILNIGSGIKSIDRTKLPLMRWQVRPNGKCAHWAVSGSTDTHTHVYIEWWPFPCDEPI